MTELEISIGGRIFSVACDNEEQEKVREAAALINEEADSIQSQLGRLPESKMLLLSALIIACLLYTSPSPRDGLLSRMPSSA